MYDEKIKFSKREIFNPSSKLSVFGKHLSLSQRYHQMRGYENHNDNRR